MLSSSKSMMNYQYKLNKQLADQNRNWQERMANSAHQRQIADLKKAGLNPVLSVTGGQGANTPTGSTASVSDNSGYASALANLQAAQLNSAATVKAALYGYMGAQYTSDMNYEIAKYNATHGSNTVSQAIANLPNLLSEQSDQWSKYLSKFVGAFVPSGAPKSHKRSHNSAKNIRSVIGAVNNGSATDIDQLTYNLLHNIKDSNGGYSDNAKFNRKNVRYKSSKRRHHR